MLDPIFDSPTVFDREEETVTIEDSNGLHHEIKLAIDIQSRDGKPNVYYLEIFAPAKHREELFDIEYDVIHALNYRKRGDRVRFEKIEVKWQ